MIQMWTFSNEVTSRRPTPASQGAGTPTPPASDSYRCEICISCSKSQWHVVLEGASCILAEHCFNFLLASLLDLMVPLSSVCIVLVVTDCGPLFMQSPHLKGLYDHEDCLVIYSHRLPPIATGTCSILRRALSNYDVRKGQTFAYTLLV